MKKFEFSTNWNKKLECDAFTTIRLSNNYIVGDLVEIYLNEKFIKNCLVIGKYRCKIGDLSELTCRLDTGYSKIETIEILKKMYGKMGITENDEINIYLLKRELIR